MLLHFAEHHAGTDRVRRAGRDEKGVAGVHGNSLQAIFHGAIGDGALESFRASRRPRGPGEVRRPRARRPRTTSRSCRRRRCRPSCARAYSSSGCTCTESLSSGKINFTSSGMRGGLADARAGPIRRAATAILRPACGPANGPVANAHCSPVSHTSPMGSGAGRRVEKRSEVARAPDARHENRRETREGAAVSRGRCCGGEEMLQAPQPFVDALDRRGVGEAQEAGRAKGVAGNDGDVLAFEQLLAPAPWSRRQPFAEARGDIREGVERAGGFRAGDSGNRAAGRPGCERGGARTRPASRGTESIGPVSAASARVLRDGRGVRRGLALQLDHGVDQRLGRRACSRCASRSWRRSSRASR